MPPLPIISDWARRLIAYESLADTTSAQTEVASFRVYEKLRQQLCALVGVDGFRALASRALSLAKSQFPRLAPVQITANGGLAGICEVESQTGTDEDGEVGIILIEQLLGLFLTFLGEATSLRLIEDIRLQVEVKTELGATETRESGPFEDILLVADQLRSMSERLETLAGKHSSVEEGLVSVAGNIRNIATVLDVFILIRSKAVDTQEDAEIQQATSYVM